MAKLFVIPSVQEVLDFIIYKQPSWPGSFSEWYAEKFWNHYQSSGWRLSSNVLMKDWKAAFCSNWKELKWEAKEKLAEFTLSEIAIKYNFPDQQIGPSPVEMLFNNFKVGKIDRKGMASIYKYLWPKMKPILTQSEVNKLVSDAGNDKEYGRYLSVKLYFTKLINQENEILQGNRK
jgi:hypothetical protein